MAWSRQTCSFLNLYPNPYRCVMVKVSGPMMSLDASGKLAGTLVFAKWKGRNYVRSLVKPANPKSGGQVGVRAMFKFLAQIWNGLTAGNKATWQDRAEDLVASPFNAFMSYNQKRWRDFDPPSKEDPAAEISTAPDACTGVATPDIRSMTVAITHGTNPGDWGCAIFRSTTSTFSLAFSNCIAVVAVDGAGDCEYVDSPLESGTYYYNTVAFMADGMEGADGTEFSGIIT